jgi:phosphatidylinositol 4-kinase
MQPLIIVQWISFNHSCVSRQVKDRHNANILIDKQGHVIHIDFGFMLGASPASFGFETAPFKLTREYAQLLGGKDDIMFERFRLAIVQGFQALNKEKHRRRLLDLLRVSILDVPDKANIVEQFFQRLEKVANPAAALAMIDESLDSRRTTWYDSYQLKVNGIMK